MLKWIDRHVAIFILAGLFGLSFVGFEVHQQADRLSGNVRDQNINRATNVHTWCSSINEGRNYNRAFVEGFHLRYTLKNIDCTAIEARTLVSAGITGKRQAELLQKIDSKKPEKLIGVSSR